VTTSGTTSGARGARGPYARGRANRDIILDTALQIIGAKGYNAMSLRDIASEVGMTQAGLLHHFQTKESLLTEILRRRDAVDNRVVGDDRYPRAIYLARHNLEVPGLMQLFVNLQAAAADPAHPAHDYFKQRYARVQASIADDIRDRQSRGIFSTAVDADEFARLLIAVFDGLQSEWCIDSSVDLVGILERIWDDAAAR
jgi:AcrR family transcriptional regulator